MKHARWIFMNVLFLSTVTQAQLTKGIWLAGGSGSFKSYTQKYNYQNPSFPTRGTAKYTNIDLNATIGYFVADNLALGITPTFLSYQGTTFEGVEIINGPRFAIGPFGRYYLLNKEKPFNILTEIIYQLGMNFSSSSIEKRRGNFNSFSLKAGPEIFFNSTIGLEVLLGYRTTTITIENTENPFSNFDSGFEMSVGFQIHLEKL